MGWGHSARVGYDTATPFRHWAMLHVGRWLIYPPPPVASHKWTRIWPEPPAVRTPCQRRIHSTPRSTRRGVFLSDNGFRQPMERAATTSLFQAFVHQSSSPALRAMTTWMRVGVVFDCAVALQLTALSFPSATMVQCKRSIAIYDACMLATVS